MISFGSKKDSDTEKKHAEFVERMIARGYTERQVRRLVEWYMRVKQGGVIGQRPVGGQANCHAYRRPPAQPERQEPRQPPALPAPGQGASRSGGAASARASASIRDIEQGGKVAHPARRRARTALPPQPAAAGSATTCCPATRSIVEGDTIPRPKGGEGGAAREGSPDGERRGRFPLRAVARRVPRPVPRRPRAAGSRQAQPGRTRPQSIWRRAGYSVDRLARQPRAAAHHAQQPVAAHRAEAAEAATRSRRCGPRSRRSSPTATTQERRAAAAGELERAEQRTQADPLCRSGRHPLPPVRAAAEPIARR